MFGLYNTRLIRLRMEKTEQKMQNHKLILKIVKVNARI